MADLIEEWLPRLNRVTKPKEPRQPRGWIAPAELVIVSALMTTAAVLPKVDATTRSIEMEKVDGSGRSTTRVAIVDLAGPNAARLLAARPQPLAILHEKPLVERVHSWRALCAHRERDW